MPFNGSGVYNLPAGNPVVNNTVASSTLYNNTNSDIATALSNTLTKDGQSTPTADIDLGGFELVGVGDGTATDAAATVKQLQNNGSITLSSVSGTDTITATIAPVPSAYAAGQIFIFEPAANNTGAVTINISSLGAKSIYLNGADIVAGVLVSGQPVSIRYNGTEFEIIAKADFASLNSENVFEANQGIGVTPSAWASSWSILETTGGSVGSNSTTGFRVGCNSYSDGVNFRYTANGAASAYQQLDGAHIWNYAASGTAGNVVTFTESARIISGGFFKATSDGAYLNGAGGNTVTTSQHSFHQSGNGRCLDVVASNTGSSAVALTTELPTGAAGLHIEAINNAATTVFRVIANGNVQNTNNSYGAISDAKLKENIVNASPKLSDLSKVRFVNFNLIGDDLKQFGVIAQELEEVFPALVEELPDTEIVETINEDGEKVQENRLTGTFTKSVNYSVLSLLFAKGVQELTEELADVKARLTALENP